LKVKSASLAVPVYFCNAKVIRKEKSGEVHTREAIPWSAYWFDNCIRNFGHVLKINS
jgi:hypothetical protein|tara:strand:+ start:366 stop:536 length:171 start_codon:yes stop_codon:yes gene_type:complete